MEMTKINPASSFGQLGNDQQRDGRLANKVLPGGTDHAVKEAAVAMGTDDDQFCLQITGLSEQGMHQRPLDEKRIGPDAMILQAAGRFLKLPMLGTKGLRPVVTDVLGTNLVAYKLGVRLSNM